MDDENILSLTSAIKGGFLGLAYYLAALDFEWFLIKR